METKSSPRPKKVKEASPNNCVLPEDIIMVNILTRLPVKSITRFKSVCKPWLQLFSTPEFVKSHRTHFSSNPKNESLIFNELDTFPGTLSLLNLDSKDKKPTTIFESSNLIKYVGCCNGLICGLFGFASARGDLKQVIRLWNPATKLVKHVPLEVNDGHSWIVSLGFGYDAERDDFKVVRIVCPAFDEEEGETVVEVYSANSDSWTTIEVGFKFYVLRDKNYVILNGNPYWVGFVGRDVVFFCFDVSRMVFKTVPPPRGVCLVSMKCKLVDLNGALGVLGWKFVDIEMAEPSLDIWVFGDGDQIWRKTKSLSLGPIQVNFCSILQCLKNGNLVGHRLDGELFVFDPDNGCVDEIVIDDAANRSFEVYGYTESLTHIDGMIKQVTGENVCSND